MPAYVNNADGSTTMISKYRCKGILTLTAIFPRSKETGAKYIVRKKGVVCSLQRKYMLHDNSALVRVIFAAFLIKILERVANGDMFLFPSTTEANLTLKPMYDPIARKLRQEGKYKDIDIVKANFKIPTFCVDFGPFSDKFDFHVHVPKRIEQCALRNAENGVITWMFKPKTFNRDVQYE